MQGCRLPIRWAVTSLRGAVARRRLGVYNAGHPCPASPGVSWFQPRRENGLLRSGARVPGVIPLERFLEVAEEHIPFMLRKAERIERLSRMVVWLDADGDGMLSVDEFDPRRGFMLSRMDRDGDGALSQEEMREAGKHYRHGKGGHHGGPGAPDQDRPKN